jgi:hypothetical protein
VCKQVAASTLRYNGRKLLRHFATIVARLPGVTVIAGSHSRVHWSYMARARGCRKFGPPGLLLLTFPLC